MRHDLKAAAAATMLVGLSFILWRLATAFGPWAIIALVPLAVCTGVGSWSLALAPLRARVRLALRPESALSPFITGQLRATVMAVVFTCVSVALIAWLALRATGTQAAVMLALVFSAGCLFAVVERMLARHFHQPFARAIAVFVATVASAAPICVIMAYAAWTWDTYPGALLTATFGDAIRIGLDQTPSELGPLGSLISIPFAYEAVKIWAVVQLKDYPIVAALFSIDSALYAFVLARTGVVVTHLLRGHHLKGPYDVE